MNDNLINSITLPQFLIRKGIVPAHGYQASSNDNRAILSVIALRVALTNGTNNQLAYSNSMDRLYTNLRRANTGAPTYSKLDLEHYLFNLRSAIAADRIMRRAYGVITNFDSLDAQKPISLFKAMGLDYNSFKDNSANLRFYLNNNSKRLHSVMAGKSSLLERTAWMFDHVFKDSDDKKAQEILFTASSLQFWDWANTTYDTAVMASFADSTTLTGLSYSTFIANVTNLMNKITDDNKVAYISADIIKAYGLSQSDGYFMEIPENYKVEAIYNPEVLCEIQNAKIARSGYTSVTHSDTTHITETVTITVPASCNTYNPVGTNTYIKTAPINFYKDSINVAEYAGATRLTFTGYLTPGSSDDTITLTSYGTEIVTSLLFVGADAANSYIYHLTNSEFTPFGLIQLTGTTGIKQVFYFHYCWSVCDWLPLMVNLVETYGTGSGTGVDGSIAFQLFDYNNYCILDSDQQFDNIHSACIYSLFYWPDVIKDQRVLTIGK